MAEAKLERPPLEDLTSNDISDSKIADSKSKGKFIREEWLQKQLQLKAKDFTETKKITVFCGTWNVNSKKSGEDLSAWLLVDPSLPTPDVYAIGFQEIVDLNAANLVIDHNASTPWEDVIEKTLKQQYLQVISKHLVGISLCIYVKQGLYKQISDLQFDTVGVGVLGVGGNKGGVAVRFTLFDSAICFVNSHLAAQQNNVNGRNSDYHNICNRIKFYEKKFITTTTTTTANTSSSSNPPTSVSAASSSSGVSPPTNTPSSSSSSSSSNPPSSSSSSSSSSSNSTTTTTGDNNNNNTTTTTTTNNTTTNPNSQQQQQQATVTVTKQVMTGPTGKLRSKSIWDHDQVFWLGDLNYRLNFTSADLNKVYKLIQDQDWNTLLLYDQLLVEKKAGTVFKDFQEGIIDFSPTYKYQPGSNEFENRSGKKIRCPSWTDRIQWRGTDIKQLFYKSTPLITSDHKPVSGLFAVECHTVVPEKRKEIYLSLERQLDAWENENIPKVNLTPTSANFPAVSFDTPVTKTVKIENVGQVVVQFHFIPKLSEQDICKPWLSVYPEYGIIPPKETLDVALTVHVNRRTAQALNTGQDQIDDVLIFRLSKGRDYFVAVSGLYLKSCFGATIDYLVNTPTPIRFATPIAPVPGKESNKVLSVPKELWRIVDYLFRHGMDHPGLFITGGKQEEIDKIRECLDTGQEFSKYSIHSMGEILIAFLKSLAEPVYSPGLVEQYAEGMALTAWCKQSLLQLSPAHYNVFIYMTSFLREVLKHAAKNKLTAGQLVLIFSQCLMQAAPFIAEDKSKEKPKSWIILKHFLTSDEFV